MPLHQPHDGLEHEREEQRQEERHDRLADVDERPGERDDRRDERASCGRVRLMLSARAPGRDGAGSGTAASDTRAEPTPRPDVAARRAGRSWPSPRIAGCPTHRRPPPSATSVMPPSSSTWPASGSSPTPCSATASPTCVAAAKVEPRLAARGRCGADLPPPLRPPRSALACRSSGREMPVVAPRGAGALIRRKAGVENVVELRAGEQIEIGRLTVRATAGRARHRPAAVRRPRRAPRLRDRG